MWRMLSVRRCVLTGEIYRMSVLFRSIGGRRTGGCIASGSACFGGVTFAAPFGMFAEHFMHHLVLEVV